MGATFHTLTIPTSNASSETTPLRLARCDSAPAVRLLGASAAAQMNAKQRRLVETALEDAFKDGTQFQGVKDVDSCLEEAGVAPLLLKSHRDEIFDCYIKLQKKHEEQLPTPSVESQRGSFDNHDGCENGSSDTGDELPPPEYISDIQLTVGIFLYNNNQFRAIMGRPCRGRRCYISKDFVKRHCLSTNGNRILISWRHTNESSPIAHTWCEVVDQRVMSSGVEFAIGDECEKQDEAAVIDEAVELPPSSHTGEIVPTQGFEPSLGMPDLTDAQLLDAEASAARMITLVSLNFTTAKRKPPPVVISQSMNSKRSRTSSGGSSAVSSFSHHSFEANNPR